MKSSNVASWGMTIAGKRAWRMLPKAASRGRTHAKRSAVRALRRQVKEWLDCWSGDEFCPPRRTRLVDSCEVV